MNEFKDPLEYLIHLKHLAGCSLRQLGEIANMSSGTLSGILNARVRLPRWSTYERILSALEGDIATGRALWLKAKVSQNLEETLSDTPSERVFCDMFINVISELFEDSGYDIKIVRELRCTSGKIWDIAFDFKRKRNR